MGQITLDYRITKELKTSVILVCVISKPPDSNSVSPVDLSGRVSSSPRRIVCVELTPLPQKHHHYTSRNHMTISPPHEKCHHTSTPHTRNITTNHYTTHQHHHLEISSHTHTSHTITSEISPHTTHYTPGLHHTNHKRNGVGKKKEKKSSF